ncbi:MAG TPA: nucleotidyltransferase family protein [Patescibacteria group bacterium]|nr:nucleotidyltransferase family protein [Patescibacteria group bacterium]
MNEKDIVNLIREDEWMMEILKTTKKLDLPGWWIGAGFIRSKVWDHLHGFKQRTPISDIDVIYFDKGDFTDIEASAETTDKEIKYENLLKEIMPGVNWSVTNQARMHLFHNHPPYKSASEGLSHWIETATCIGIKIDENNKLILTAPHGIRDLVNLVLRPTPNTGESIERFDERVASKKWLTKWPKLKILRG